MLYAMKKLRRSSIFIRRRVIDNKTKALLSLSLTILRIFYSSVFVCVFILDYILLVKNKYDRRVKV